MTTMISEVYDALLEAGASEGKARAAAEAIASYDREISQIKGRLTTLQWMVGTNIVLTLGVLGRLLHG